MLTWLCSYSHRNVNTTKCTKCLLFKNSVEYAPSHISSFTFGGGWKVIIVMIVIMIYSVFFWYSLLVKR